MVAGCGHVSCNSFSPYDRWDQHIDKADSRPICIAIT